MNSSLRRMCWFGIQALRRVRKKRGVVQKRQRKCHKLQAEARAEARARHRARMRALLDERDQLRLQALQEEELLQQEIARRDEAFRRVQMMEERRHQLLLQREQDMAELAALDEAGNAAAEVDVEADNEEKTEKTE